jgi:hypothetical protein
MAIESDCCCVSGVQHIIFFYIGEGAYLIGLSVTVLYSCSVNIDLNVFGCQERCDLWQSDFGMIMT